MDVKKVEEEVVSGDGNRRKKCEESGIVVTAVVKEITKMENEIMEEKGVTTAAKAEVKENRKKVVNAVVEENGDLVFKQC